MTEITDEMSETNDEMSEINDDDVSEINTEINDKNQEKMKFGLIIGIIYVMFGILQAIATTGLLDIPLVPGNAIGVLVLFVIGAVFLSGYRELKDGIPEGISFIHVGIMLSLVFGIIYCLVMGADAFEAYVLGNEDFEDWTFVDGLRPELYLALLSLMGFFKWRDEFTDENENLIKSDV